MSGPSRTVEPEPEREPETRNQKRERPMTHPLQVLLLLALVIAAAKAAGAAANRIGQPAVFGEILIGLLLGPTLLDVLGWPIFAGSGDDWAR